MSSFDENLNAIRGRMNRAASQASRQASDITLVAVSKQQSQDRIQAALDAGHRVFGENRVQEAHDHWAGMAERYPDLQLHLIGPLQTNKVKAAVAIFNTIQTIDRPALADEVMKEIYKQWRHIYCMVQVNIGDEPQKSGVSVQGLPALLKHCGDIGLVIDGLMCIPPLNDAPEKHFSALRDLAEDYGLPQLSMGMSDDFETAIAYGATHVRIGSALFGDRGQ